jgi:hypothetical protein
LPERVSPRQRSGFAEAMRDAFCRLVLGIDRRLFLAQVQGAVVIDGAGDGSCDVYIRHFQDLDLSGQQLFAAPFFQPSSGSQWIQIADVVAFSAFHAVAKRPDREFCWTWYEDYIDPAGPREV